MSGHSREFLESFVARARESLPDWMFREIHVLSRSPAGGKASHRVDEPTELEKLALREIRPSVLRRAPDLELTSAWRRLHQWYVNARRKKRPVETFVNAAVWVAEEMDRRGMKREADTDLGREVERLLGARKEAGLTARLAGVPKEVVVVPGFVSVVGSHAKGEDDPDDLDVLFRAQKDERGESFLVHAEGVMLQVRNALDPDKLGDLHYIDNPQGPHGDHVPVYDLVLRARDPRVEVVKGIDRVDLGCGDAKPEGYYGIDIKAGDDVDQVHDLEHGIPLPDESVEEIRASHVLEHLSSPDTIMREVHRVLRPGGEFEFEVPSTRGEGAFAHPDHKSFWNASSFAFWTDPKLLDDRPRFDLVELEEEGKDARVYVRGRLRKPEEVKKELRPFGRLIPPKPTVAGFTELFDVRRLWEWAKGKGRIAVEPKHNGFRAIAEKAGGRTRLWFEGSRGTDRLPKMPAEIREALEAVPGDYVLDLDVGIERGGERLPRPELMRLTAKKPELAEGERVVLTAFDLPYDGEDLSGRPFEERRKRLEAFVRKRLKGPSFRLSPLRWVSSLPQLRSAARWAFRQDRSEGLVAKTARGKYETGGSTNEWSKLKRVAELKVRVLGKKRAATGAWNYRGGLLLSAGDDWTNTVEAGGSKYVDLGDSFNTSVKADVGDIITVEVLELIPDEKRRRLAWLGARVQDVDETRKTPYTTRQALGIAARGGVLQKAVGEEGGTRSAAARKFWSARWHEMPPSSGKGRFTYHHHWRGLSEEQARDLDEGALLRTDHSLHGDLRFESDDGLWGFSVFLGKTADNRKADRLFALKSDDALRGAFKLRQPKQWLDVGKRKPLAVEPGGVGATSEKWSKFFVIDNGTYEVGVWHRNFVEVFLHGDKLKGRFIFENVPVEGGQRVWMVKRPKDQTPFAESHELEDVVAERKKRGRRWLIWAKPGERPKKIDVRTGRMAKEHRVRKVSKAVEERQVILGVVLDPYQFDKDDDWAPPAAVEETAHDYMAASRVIGFRHLKDADRNPVATTGKPVESTLFPYPSDEDYRAAMDWKPHRIYRFRYGDDLVHSGAWVLGTKLPDALWAMYKRGELNAYSIGGSGVRTPVEDGFDPMDMVTEVIVVDGDKVDALTATS